MEIVGLFGVFGVGGNYIREKGSRRRGYDEKIVVLRLDFICFDGGLFFFVVFRF